VKLEVALRPLRLRVGEASKAMFGKVPDSDVAPERLAALASNLYELLAAIIHDVTRFLDVC
jgi:hypothetical protein